MAVSVTYSINQVFPPGFVPSGRFGISSDSDTVGFSNGGWATSLLGGHDFSDITFYNAAGTAVASDFGFGSQHGRLAQLTNGNVVAVGTPVAGGVNFHIDSSTGGLVGSGSVTTTTTESKADVAALAGGGFVVVDQRLVTAPDHNIEVHLRDATGNVVTNFAVDGTGADDENASVAGLADGGFAVAWERIDGSGNTTAWLAVYNADGSVRKAPTEFDGIGTANHQMNVTALGSGGFSVGYQDNEYGTGNDITVASFDSSGALQNFSHASTLTSDDTEASVTTLSNGLVMSTFTNNFFDSGDLDILATLVDPTTGAALTDPANPLFVDFSIDVTSASSVSALNLARFAVSYTNASWASVEVATYQLVRTVTGTSGADTFVGDDAVNIISGLGGDDALTGGNNADNIDGGTGNDKLFGLGGKDTLDGGLGADTLDGGTGLDTASYASSKAGVQVDLNITGPQSSTGYASGDVLNSIEGLTASAFADRLTGDARSNPLSGGKGADVLVGYAGNDALDGGVGNDTLNGGIGADKLTGGAGADRLTGGTDADSFVFVSVAESTVASAGRDTITDFSHAQADKIDLHTIDASTVAAGNQAFHFIGTAAFGHHAGELRYWVGGGNAIVSGDVNGDGTVDFSVLLGHVTSLVAGDFVL